MYAQQAVSINEFSAPRWDTPTLVPLGDGTTITQRLGDAVLTSRSLFTDRYWTWIGMAALVFYWVAFNFISMLALQYLNMYKGDSVAVSEHEIAARQKGPSRKSLALAQGTTATDSAKTLHGMGNHGVASAKVKGTGAADVPQATYLDSSHGSDDVAVDLPSGSSLDDDKADASSNARQLSRIGNLRSKYSRERSGKLKGDADGDHVVLEMSSKSAAVRQSGQHGMILPFEPLSMCFRHIKHYVPNPNVSTGLLVSRFTVCLVETRRSVPPTHCLYSIPPSFLRN